MQRDGDGRILIVVGTSLLINFLLLDRVDILGRLTRFRFSVLNHVVEEVRHADQRARIQDGLAAGHVREIEMTDFDQILLYDELRMVLGDGEAACLAVAVKRGWVVAGDEKGRFRRELVGRPGEGYLLDTPGVLISAIRAGVITITEADILRTTLRENRFHMDPRPFEELMKEE